MKENQNVIEFEHISKSFGAVHALRDVSFSIRRGECHAVIGENGAGKSTLMHILAGSYKPTAGNVRVNGREVLISNETESKKLGIAIVYQELKLCLNLTAAENVFLGKIPTKAFGVINRENIDRKVIEMMKPFGVEIDVTAPVAELGPAQMQLIEIAKALNENADVIILDEPTSSLTATESETLFKLLRQLKEQGKTLIFISHRLNEIFEMADRISVMRDGMYLGTYPTEEIDENRLIQLIAGEERYHEIYSHIERETSAPIVRSEENVILEVNHLNRGKWVQDESFKLYRGEILGLYGLQGSGRTELVETIFGMYGKPDGQIKVNGKEVEIKNPEDAIREGFGLLTEDRKNRGIFSLMDIRENIAVIHKKKITKGKLFLDNKKIDDLSRKYIDALSIKLDTIKESILNLSGGNQQKVVLARMLSTDPLIILADEPTRGIDVGAKSEIFALLNQLRREGKSIIVISSELKEIIRECDRVLVLHNQRIVGEVIERENREEKILQYAFNG